MIRKLIDKFRKKKPQPVEKLRYSAGRWVPEDVVESMSNAVQTLADTIPPEDDKPTVHVEPPAPEKPHVETHTKPLDYHTTPAEKPEPSHHHHESHHNDAAHHDSHHDSHDVSSHDAGGYDSGGFDSGGCDGGGCDGGGGGD